MAEQFGSKYRKNITHSRIMSLWGRNEEQTVASFNLYITGNTLHLTVYTGLNDDKQKQQKNIKFDFKDGQIVSFLTFLNSIRKLKDIPHDGEKKTISATIMGFVRGSGGKAERREIGKLVGGRNSQGIYCISAINNTHGKVMFNFELDRDMVIYDVNSSDPLSQAEASERVMVSFIDNAKNIIANVLTQEYVEKEQQNNQRNNNGGNSNWRNNQNNQGNNNQSKFSNNNQAPDVGDDFEDFLP